MEFTDHQSVDDAVSKAVSVKGLSYNIKYIDGNYLFQRMISVKQRSLFVYCCAVVGLITT